MRGWGAREEGEVLVVAGGEGEKGRTSEIITTGLNQTTPITNPLPKDPVAFTFRGLTIRPRVRNLKPQRERQSHQAVP